MGWTEIVENAVFGFSDRLAGADPRMQYCGTLAAGLMVLSVLVSEAPWIVDMKGNVCWSIKYAATMDQDNVVDAGGKSIRCKLGDFRASMYRFREWETRSLEMFDNRYSISVLGPGAHLGRKNSKLPQFIFASFSGGKSNVFKIPQ